MDTAKIFQNGKRQAIRLSLERLLQHSFTEIGVSSLTIAELQYGVAKSSDPVQNQEALDEFLIPFTFLAFDELSTVAYGEIRTTLEAQAIPIGAVDFPFAARALSNQLTFVTNNAREFARILGLRIEDWTQPDPNYRRLLPAYMPLEQRN
jgi:tRNA(fMet)-specific endonuclease VapC